MAYRFASPSQVFYNLAGAAPVPGGSWEFFETDTTTPKATCSDPEFTIPNANPLTLDASARLPNDVWLEGDYFAQLKDAAGVVVWNGQITNGQDAGQVLPALGADQIFVGDGSNILAEDFVRFPDPSGSADYMLVVNGSADGFTLIPQPVPPEIPEPEVVLTTSSARIGQSDDPTKGLWQYGIGVTTTGVGTKTATGVVTYPTPYATAPFVLIQPKGGPHAPGNGSEGGYFAHASVTADSVTQFTATLSTATGEANSDGNISGAISFTWAAYGTVEVAAE